MHHGYDYNDQLESDDAFLGQVPVCNEDLEGIDNVNHWDCLVTLPLAHDLCVLNEDNEVILLALVVNFCNVCFSFGHVGDFIRLFVV